MSIIMDNLALYIIKAHHPLRDYALIIKYVNKTCYLMKQVMDN